MLISFVSRNHKVFFRNKTLVFFSILSVIIVIALYAIFLQKTQFDAIEQWTPVLQEIKVMVNEWMVAGLLSIIAVTTTLVVFGIYVKDIETKMNADFLTTAASRAKIQLSYVLSALLIGFIMSVFSFLLCEIFLFVTGGSLLSFSGTIKVLGILLLSVALSSVINLVFVLFIKTQTAFSTLSTIIGTVIGFLNGVYIPIGALPSFVQSIIHYFPISHTTVLLRSVLMEDSLSQVFAGNVVARESYSEMFGVVYEMNDTMIRSGVSILYIVGTMIVLGAVALIIFTRKNV